MTLKDRLQSLTAWKGTPFVHEGPEPAHDQFGVKFWNAADASLGLSAMLEELLLRWTKFSDADQLLILADFTTVVLNDLRRGGVSPGQFLLAELFVIGDCDIAVVIAHDAVPDLPDRDAEDGTAAHVGYDETGRCCFLHFTHGPRG